MHLASCSHGTEKSKKNVARKMLAGSYFGKLTPLIVSFAQIKNMLAFKYTGISDLEFYHSILIITLRSLDNSLLTKAQKVIVDRKKNCKFVALYS